MMFIEKYQRGGVLEHSEIDFSKTVGGIAANRTIKKQYLLITLSTLITACEKNIVGSFNGFCIDNCDLLYTRTQSRSRASSDPF